MKLALANPRPSPARHVSFLAAVLAALAGPGSAAQAAGAAIPDLTVCRTDPASPACHSFGLSTQARFDDQGRRNGTLVSLSLRNLQGQVVQDGSGQRLDSGSGPSLLRSVTFYAFWPKDFQGLDYGAARSGLADASSSGPVGGQAADWQWSASKSIYDGNSILSFQANSSWLVAANTTLFHGIGGCADGGGTLLNEFGRITGHTSTCASRGETGPVALGFSTDFIFDATQFSSARIDWQQQANGIGPFGRYFCATQSDALGAWSVSGGCSGFASSVSAVPEPAAVALWSLGLAGLGIGLRRRAARSAAAAAMDTGRPGRCD